MATSTRPERTFDRRKRHYEIEKGLATTLRQAPRDERLRLYSALYDELFALVPEHPQLVRQESSQQREQKIRAQMDFLARFLTKDTVFLEIGAGDCALSLAVAERARTVYALEVSSVITRSVAGPDNFSIVFSDGCDVLVPPGTIDIAYSNQVMEHLHPDDAREQLANVRAALAPDGKYIVITPNRLSGPHDISRGFDAVATGFHLREYSIGELAVLLRTAGFRNVRKWARLGSRYVPLPILPFRMLEAVIDAAPNGIKRRLLRNHFAKSLLSVRLVATK